MHENVHDLHESLLKVPKLPCGLTMCSIVLMVKSRLATTVTQPWMLLVMLLVGIGCGPSIPAYEYHKEPDPRTSEFILGVSDTIRINVWKNPQLSTEVTIRPDGTITMPLVGDIVAAGKSPSVLRVEIEKRVKQFVKLEGSEITIAVLSVNSYRFTVSGEVGRPGIFNSTSYVTIAEAVAQAGGFSRFAKRNKIILMRRNAEGVVRRIPIVFDAIADGSHPEMNLVILAGDSLHVP